MKKSFDCVEMKHRAQDRIYEETKGLTHDQLVAYWEERNRKAREIYESLRAKLKTA